MDERVEDFLVGCIPFIIGIILLGLFIGLPWYLNFQQSYQIEFCESVHPSLIEGREVWVLIANTEPGYVDCCRKIAVDHRLEDDCKVFKDG